jgi:hypothetical protein
MGDDDDRWLGRRVPDHEEAFAIGGDVVRPAHCRNELRLRGYGEQRLRHARFFGGMSVEETAEVLKISPFATVIYNYAGLN